MVEKGWIEVRGTTGETEYRMAAAGREAFEKPQRIRGKADNNSTR
jgi:hypothetical protein